MNIEVNTINEESLSYSGVSVLICVYVESKIKLTIRLLEFYKLTRFLRPTGRIHCLQSFFPYL